MKRTTVMADETLLLEAAECARKEGKTLTALFQEALREYLAAHSRKPQVSFIGVGHSGVSFTPERDAEELKRAIEPVGGWSPRRSPKAADRG